MKVLVTGASGFLGSHVAEELVRQGHVVRALVRKTSNRKFLESLGAKSNGTCHPEGRRLEGPRVELAEGSVEEPDKVADAVDGVDAIIHVAGLVKARGPEEFHATNVGGTKNLLDAARRHAKGLRRFVFVSSQAAVGPSPDGKPLGSAHPPSPVTHYGRSKLEAERAVLDARGDLPVVVIRPPLIYGPRDNETFAFFQSVARGVLPMLGDGKNTLSVVYASDAAAACVRAVVADVPSGRVYFVDDGEVYVWRDALADIERALGKRALVRVGLPLGVMNVAALFSEAYGKMSNKAVMLTRDKLNELKQKHWVIDSQDTRRDLDWSPSVKWPEGTKRAADWYREQGWL
jgi:nucleoside-diphosphate-sugar epimerase